MQGLLHSRELGLGEGSVATCGSHEPGLGEASLQEHGVISRPVDRWEHREMRIGKGDL